MYYPEIADKAAYLMFSSDGCYVQPIDSLASSTILKEVAYVGGNLYPDRHGLTFKGIEVEVHDDVFLYNYGGEHFWTPVVKVGSTFWTRRDIAHDMGFTPYPEDDDNQDLIDYRTGTLFTSFQFDLTYTASVINGWNYGYKVNPYFKTDNNQLWYLPQPSQVRNLFTFIGQNPKALFRGQMKRSWRCVPDAPRQSLPADAARRPDIRSCQYGHALAKQLLSCAPVPGCPL